MPTYKLMYFNTRGRAEVVRMLFVIGGQEFEDYRFKEGEWPTIKGDTSLFPFNQAPVLLVDGKPVPHSKAIAQHLAREFGLYGANNEEALRIDLVGETVNDISSKMIPIYYEKDEAKKKEAVETFREASKIFFMYLNNCVKEAGGKFFVGNNLTLADVTVYTTIDYADQILGADFVASTYPDLRAFHNGTTSHPKLAEYIKNRPQN